MALGALAAVLSDSGPAILIGEGTGGNMAWITADYLPEQVRAVLAVEPDSPPFGFTTPNLHSSDRDCLPIFKLHPPVRPYGISHIPLNFDPPANPVTEAGGMPIPVSETLREDHQAYSFDQDRNFPIRKLPNLRGMPHAAITTECSWNSLGVWATVKFLRGAGLQVEHIELQQLGIQGNGQLCFLELNNGEIAQLLHYWIMHNVIMVLHPVDLDPAVESGRVLLESVSEIVLSPPKTVQPAASSFGPLSSPDQSLVGPIQASTGISKPPSRPVQLSAGRYLDHSSGGSDWTPDSPAATRDSVGRVKYQKLPPAPPLGPCTTTPKGRAKLAAGRSSPDSADPAQGPETPSRKPPPRQAAAKGAKKLAKVYRKYGKIPAPPIGPPPDLTMAGKRKARHEEDDDEDYKPERRRKTNKPHG